jgi:anti-sigma factor RsiW
MNGNEHGRAMDLLTRREVEGVSDADARWLESHLAACEDCASYELTLSGAERAMRSVTVMASASLVGLTQARVRACAAQLRERGSRRFLIAISFAMGLVFSTLSASAWWKVGGWMVDRFSLPSAIVGPGLVLFWLLPAVLLGVLLVTFPDSKFEGSVMHLFMKDRQRGIQ